MKKIYRRKTSNISLHIALLAMVITGGWLINKQFRIIDFAKKDLRSPYLRGVNEMQSANFQNAQRHFELAKNKSPNDANTVYSLAWALQAQAKDDEALKYYQQAELLAKASGNKSVLERIYTNTGAIYLKRKQFHNAEMAFRSAIKVNSKSADTNYQLGLALLESKKIKDARRSFEQTLNLDPTYQAAKFQLQLLTKSQTAPKYSAKRRPASTHRKK